jgi:hypothetical protein
VAEIKKRKERGIFLHLFHVELQNALHLGTIILAAILLAVTQFVTSNARIAAEAVQFEAIRLLAFAKSGNPLKTFTAEGILAHAEYELALQRTGLALSISGNTMPILLPVLSP